MRSHPSPGRLRALLRSFYPIPEALVGYLVGILAALPTLADPTGLYYPLPMKEALTEAASAELPFWIAAALLAFIRPVALCGSLLVSFKAASCGFGAATLLLSGEPSLLYFRYVVVSLLVTAIYACLIRQAADSSAGDKRSGKAPSKEKIGDYLLRWLFYSGSALLLIPLKYFTGF